MRADGIRVVEIVGREIVCVFVDKRAVGASGWVQMHAR